MVDRTLHRGASGPYGHPSVLMALAESAQQPPDCCIGGHLTEPYEQNTQQSPAFGRSKVLQRVHS